MYGTYKIINRCAFAIFSLVLTYTQMRSSNILMFPQSGLIRYTNRLYKFVYMYVRLYSKLMCDIKINGKIYYMLIHRYILF